MTDRESRELDDASAPQDASGAQGAEPGPHETAEPPAPSPSAPPSPAPGAPPWERQPTQPVRPTPPSPPSPPQGGGSAAGAAAGANAHGADRPANGGMHRSETGPERTGRPPLPQRERGEDTTHVVRRRDWGPPPMTGDAAPPWGNRDAPPGRPGGRASWPSGESTGPQRMGEPPRGEPQRTGEPPTQQWPGPSRQPEPPRYAEAYADGDAAGGEPGNWSYVDRIRTSELVPTRKVPPGRGWRRLVFKASFGLINPGQSPDERRLAELEAKIRSLLRGRYKIAVLGKGGTGKSTIAAAVGSIFAELRQDDRVVAIDADTAFGKLGSRIDPKAAGSYWELAADQYLNSFADVRARVGSNAAGLFVLAGESATARRRKIDPAIYREATARLDNHFTVSIIDCGSTMDHDVTNEVLRDVDALIVVSSPWVDGASAAGQTMELLAHSGYTGLLHRTVVVLNDSDGHADKRTRTLLREQLGSRGQVVVELPYDQHLRPGGVIDVDNEINSTTRRRLIEIAAAIAEHFPATTDGPRERR